MSDAKSSDNRQNVSFAFTKRVQKSVMKNRLDEAEANTDYVTSVDEREIQSTRTKEKPHVLVIPLIKKNNWRVPGKKQENKNEESIPEEEKKIKDLAILELLKESNEKNAEWENRDYSIQNTAIPLIMQNKIPEGYETDDKMDVSLRAEESKLEDYDRVPIEQYGFAMLRGMGWKEGDAIGNNSKQVVQPIQVQVRPKGLGLGADTSALKKSQKKAKEEKLQLVKGAYVNIVQGPHKGFYGEVLGLDEENARVIVKLSTDEKNITFPEFFISLVTKKEFDKESRIINRATYEKYKRDKEFDEKNAAFLKKDNKRKDEEKNLHKEQKRHRDSSPRDNEPSKSRKSSKKSKHRKNSEEREGGRPKLWLRPQLKVRFIDDQYKKGKYFNSKVIVVDVLSSKTCSCKTDDGKYLDDIAPTMLETVVPRDDSAYVMIVQGKYAGELCTILKRDKSKCIATVQFLSDRNHALKIEYDNICEYVGDVSQFD